MDVNDNAVSLIHSGVPSTIASKLAPTEEIGFPKKFKNWRQQWPKQKYSVAPGSVAR